MGQVLSGTYISRPALTAVDTLYVCTDLPEQYIWNGTTWLPAGGGGAELARADYTSMFVTTSPDPVDVAGWTLPFVSGERPVEIRLSADVTNSGSGIGTAYLVVDGTVRGRIAKVGGADGWDTKYKANRVRGLAPGVTHVAKVQLSSSTTASIARIGGDTINPASLTVVTL